MMSREDSSVLELSIYSEASSSSGDEDDDDDLASEWSEWEDPLWVKDDNLRYHPDPHFLFPSSWALHLFFHLCLLVVALHKHS
jgi:hypothetical protein